MYLQSLFTILCGMLLLSAPIARSAEAPKTNVPDSVPADTLLAFKAKLKSTLTRHLNQLLGSDGAITTIKGKTGDGNEALAFYLMFENTGEQKFRNAALNLADQVLKAMRATKSGVLPIKEKEKPDGRTIMGGGPPALGAYASDIAYILHKAGGRNDDLQFIATVLDKYPWNENGWWAADIGTIATDTSTGPLTTSFAPGIVEINNGTGHGYTPNISAGGDFNGDWRYNIENFGAGVSDFYQFSAIVNATYLGNFSLDASGNLTFNAVPEPSSLALAGLGLLVVSLRTGLRRKQA